jgi:methanogenic corrinoid protein MtbC1
MAARASGVSEVLIRAWERRYGLLKPHRTPRGYRAYTEVDIEVLRRIKRLTVEGVSIQQAALQAEAIRREVESLGAPAVVDEPFVLDEAQWRLWNHRLIDAARSLNQEEVEATFDEALSVLSPQDFIDRLVVPLQREIGQRWHRGDLSVAQEHVVTHVVRARLLELLKMPVQTGPKHVVFACFPNEEHDVGLLSVALRFHLAGVRVTWLGPKTPIADVVQAVLTLFPDAVALSAVHDFGRAAFATELRALTAALPSACKVLMGGAAARMYSDVCTEMGVENVDSVEAFLAAST